MMMMLLLLVVVVAMVMVSWSRGHDGHDSHDRHDGHDGHDGHGGHGGDGDGECCTWKKMTRIDRLEHLISTCEWFDILVFLTGCAKLCRYDIL